MPVSSFVATRPADSTHIVFNEARWEATPDGDWTSLPGATIPLDIGQGAASYGALFVATFSAEVIASVPGNNGTVFITVFFGDQQAEPVSDNHRTVSANGGPSWASHTLIRTIRFDPQLGVKDITARIKITSNKGTRAGIQNWVFKVERFNI